MYVLYCMCYIVCVRMVYVHVRYVFELSLFYCYVERGYEYQFVFVYI
jgi:hypothetical protein